MVDLLNKRNKEIVKAEQERILWLKIITISIITAVILFLFWQFFVPASISAVVGFVTSVLLLILVIWWLWTMKILKQIIFHKQLEVDILIDLIHDLETVKKNLKDLGNHK